MKPVDVKILCGGQNWMAVGSRIAIGLDGYYSRLPKGSTASTTTADPGQMCYEAPLRVAEGKYHMAITTPAWFLKTAVEGIDPYDRKLPLRTLAVFPHDDRMVFAVKRRTGIASFEDIKKKQYPLKLTALPRTTWHPALWAAETVLKEYGLSFDMIESWGGKLLGDRPRFQNHPSAKPASDEFDAIFDEATMTRRWKRLTDENDMVFLPVDQPVLKRLEERAWQSNVIVKGRFRGVEQDVPCVDFSGWILFCREDMDEELAYLTIESIDEQREFIENLFPQPFAAMTSKINMRNLAVSPPVPLHAGAERYYRKHGHL